MKTEVNKIDLKEQTKEVRKVINEHLENETPKTRKGEKVYPADIFGNIAMNHAGCNGPVGCSQRTINTLFKLYQNSKNFKFVHFED